MTNETQSHNTLRAKVFLPRDRVTRVENLCEPGTPDTSVCCEGRDVWIEIKTPKNEPKREGTRLLGSQHCLSQEQMNWLKMHHRAGGRGFVYIDAPSRRYLISGEHADEINDASPTELMLMADWTAPVPTAGDRWTELREKIRA